MKRIRYILIFLMTFMFIGYVNAFKLHYKGDGYGFTISGTTTGGVSYTKDNAQQFFYCKDDNDFNSNSISCSKGQINVFCIERTNSNVAAGVDYTGVASETINERGVACGALQAVLDENITSLSLPDPSLGDTSPMMYETLFSQADYIKIQQKIWRFEDDNEPCSFTRDVTLPTGTLNISEDNINLTQSGSYYIGTIHINKTNLIGNYGITKSNSNLVISETSSGSNVTDSSATTLYVKIPINKVNADTNITVTLQGTYHSKNRIVYKGIMNVYSNSGSNNQKMGKFGVGFTVTPTPAFVEDTVTLRITVPRGQITIVKKDDQDHGLAGAEFQISSDEAFTSPQTIRVEDTGRKIVSDLTYGDYWIRETKAPAGYIKSSEAPAGYTMESGKVKVTIGPNALTHEVVFKNNPIQIILNKADFGTKQNLVGSKITVKTLKNGSIVNLESDGLTNGTWTSTARTLTLKPIVAGDYYIYESKVPEGYEGGTYKVNNADKTAVLHIVINANGAITTTEYGTITGNTFTKITSSDDDREFFKVDKANHKITLYNYKLTEISKKDITGAKELEGAHILITNDADKDFKKEFVSKKEPTKMYLEKLDAGKYYYMTETAAPVGYETLVTVFKFTVDENGKPTLVSIGKWEDEAKTKYKEEKKVSSTDNFKTKDNTITLLDEPIKIELYKKDSDTKKMIKGAHLVIKDESKKKTIKECDSQASDPCKLDLEPGIYYFMETKTPDGYEKNTAEYKIQVLESREVKLLSDKSKEISVNKNTITLYNVKVEVPDTGKSKNNNLLIIAIAGVLLAGLGLIVYILIKRKRAVNSSI